MKNRYILPFIFAFFSLLCFGQSALISEADQAYMDNDFEKALDLYLQAAETEGSSSALYYNIGNTYYRLNELGNAVLYYKKSLKIDPKNSDAQTNLDFVKTKLIDEQETSASLSKSVGDKMLTIFTPNGWAVAAIGAFALVLIALGIYILAPTVSLRKTSFFGGIILLIFTVVATVFAFRSANRLLNQKEGVITVPTTTLSTVPRIPHSKNEEAFSLHEGAIVEIIDSISVPTDSINPLWYEVKADDSHRAWLPSSDLSKI